VKSNGFTIIEVIVASTILMTVITTMVPIISILEKEQNILSERRVITHQLHDELQPYLWGDNLSSNTEFTKVINKQTVTFHFLKENDYLKGCVRWENGRKRNETVCLYGLPEV